MEQDTAEPGKKYSPLSLQEREEIAIGLEKGESKRSIARRLGRAPSTISRETRRNNDTPFRAVKYRATVAQKRAEDRKKAGHHRERLKNRKVRKWIERKLKDGWTPQSIAGRLSHAFSGEKSNYESIYQWIYTERRDLIKYLVRGHKKRHKRSNSKQNRVGKIPGRVDISHRPAEVNLREEAGHWEADTMVSRSGKEAVAVFVERKSRLYLVEKLKDKSAAEMRRAAVKALGRLPEAMRKTITFDNGTENALHREIGKALGMKTYFCKPYHSWEKGSIENRNGILRRYFPKKYDWGLTTQKELDRVVSRINTTPMKCLRFQTPAEIFASCSGVALAG